MTPAEHSRGGGDAVWGGGACVALVLFPGAFPSSLGDASVPSPHPPRSRPYGTLPSFLVFRGLFSSLDAYWAQFIASLQTDTPMIVFNFIIAPRWGADPCSRAQ